MVDDPLYTTVCSATTLQSNKQGFFQDFADGVTEKIGKDWLNCFEKLPNNREKILKCYTDPSVNNVIQETLQNVQGLYRTKSARLAYLRRLEAERCVRSNNYEKALMLLNQSVIRSPCTGIDKTVDDGQTLPLALWERAKVLYALSEFSLCLNDIQLSLKEKLPDPLCFQAYYSMAECYEKMKQIKRARISLQVASKLLKKGDSEWNLKIHEKMCSLAELSDETVIQNCTTKDLKLTNGENPVLPNASCLLSVENSLSAGRFVVAQHPVKTGDTLVIEAPYAACLLPEKFGSHCHHCFKRLRIAVPCPDCSGVAFCSIACQNSSVKGYHKYECKYMDIMIGSGMSILCYIALRIITQQNPAYWYNINEIKDADFKRFQELVTHSDKRPAKDYFHRTLMALFLLRILDCSGYITRHVTGRLSEYELQVATIILQSLQGLQFNAHEIYETVMNKDKDFKTTQMKYIAVGIYLTVSLFNHDCYPAVIRYFSGKDIIIKAVRPLSPGEVVAENYGPIFTKRTLSERTRNLTSRYWFRCTCKACQEDWPTFDKMDENVVRIKCMQKECKGYIVTRLDTEKQKNIKCPACKKTINIAETVVLIKSYSNDFEKGISLMDTGYIEEAINVLCAFSDVMHVVCAPPAKTISLSHVALQTCWSTTGNIYIVKGSESFACN